MTLPHNSENHILQALNKQSFEDVIVRGKAVNTKGTSQITFEHVDRSVPIVALIFTKSGSVRKKYIGTPDSPNLDAEFNGFVRASNSGDLQVSYYACSYLLPPPILDDREPEV